MPLPALHSQPVPAAAKTAPAPELSLRGGRRPTWRPEREARGSALGVQSREGTAVPYRPPLKWQTPKYGVQRRSLRSRWRLCRLTDAASPLRGLSALQAVGFAARIRWRKANKFVIARALCARGNLGQAVAILPIAFPRCGRVLRDSHVASLLGMTILEPLRVRRCRSLYEPIRKKKTGPLGCVLVRQ